VGTRLLEAEATAVTAAGRMRELEGRVKDLEGQRYCLMMRGLVCGTKSLDMYIISNYRNRRREDYGAQGAGQGPRATEVLSNDARFCMQHLVLA
jgi:hypothetical protein